MPRIAPTKNPPKLSKLSRENAKINAPHVVRPSGLFFTENAPKITIIPDAMPITETVITKTPLNTPAVPLHNLLAER